MKSIQPYLSETPLSPAINSLWIALRSPGFWITSLTAAVFFSIPLFTGRIDGGTFSGAAGPRADGMAFWLAQGLSQAVAGAHSFSDQFGPGGGGFFQPVWLLAGRLTSTTLGAVILLRVIGVLVLCASLFHAARTFNYTIGRPWLVPAMACAASGFGVFLEWTGVGAGADHAIAEYAPSLMMIWGADLPLAAGVFTFAMCWSYSSMELERAGAMIFACIGVFLVSWIFPIALLQWVLVMLAWSFGFGLDRTDRIWRITRTGGMALAALPALHHYFSHGGDAAVVWFSPQGGESPPAFLVLAQLGAPLLAALLPLIANASFRRVQFLGVWIVVALITAAFPLPGAHRPGFGMMIPVLLLVMQPMRWPGSVITAPPWIVAAVVAVLGAPTTIQQWSLAIQSSREARAPVHLTDDARQAVDAAHETAPGGAILAGPRLSLLAARSGGSRLTLAPPRVYPSAEKRGAALTRAAALGPDSLLKVLREEKTGAVIADDELREYLGAGFEPALQRLSCAASAGEFGGVQVYNTRLCLTAPRE
ncbi:MAG: hypothetical protein GMKNLPBB_02537 [Myxococcota bacterium]|nr:hypothetical protein [Myxococcota bacterium]